MTVVAIGSASFGTADPAPLRRLTEAGIEVRRNPLGRRLDESETLAHVREADGWLAGSEPVSRRVMAAASRLRAVARIGVGLDNVDMEAAEALDIPVSITPDAPTDAVAEATLGGLLALTRHLVAHQVDLRAGRWVRHLGTSLAGLPVLVVGYGRIGRRTTSLLRAFRADVRVSDPAVSSAEVPVVSLQDGLPWARAVVLHASGRSPILDQQAFEVMRDGTWLLNAARGALVDEAALLDALDAGRVAGAWLDVFAREPYDGPLARRDDVLVTPHAATFTRECRLRMELEAVDNLLADLQRTPPRDAS